MFNRGADISNVAKFHLFSYRIEEIDLLNAKHRGEVRIHVADDPVGREGDRRASAAKIFTKRKRQATYVHRRKGCFIAKECVLMTVLLC